MLRRIVIALAAVAAIAVPLASADDTTPPADTGGVTDTGGGTPPTGQIAPGVTVYGVAVGGMTAEQARAAVQESFQLTILRSTALQEAALDLIPQYATHTQTFASAPTTGV